MEPDLAQSCEEVSQGWNRAIQAERKILMLLQVSHHFYSASKETYLRLHWDGRHSRRGSLLLLLGCNLLHERCDLVLILAALLHLLLLMLPGSVDDQWRRRVLVAGGGNCKEVNHEWLKLLVWQTTKKDKYLIVPPLLRRRKTGASSAFRRHLPRQQT